MPATPTEPTPSVQNTGAASLASGSFTPSANSLIIAKVTARNASLQAFSGFSSTFAMARGWWTETFDIPAGSETGEHQRCIIGTCIASASPGAGTITATFAGTQSEIQLEVAEVASDFDPTAPVRQGHRSHTGFSNSTSLTGNLPATPISSGLLIGAGGGAANAADISPATGYTELGEHDTATMQSNIQHAAGSNGTGYGCSFTVAQQIAASAIEIEAPHSHVGRPHPLMKGQFTLLGSSTHQNNVNKTPKPNSRVYVFAWWSDVVSRTFTSLSTPWGGWTQEVLAGPYGSNNVWAGVFSCDAGASPAAGAPILTVSAGVEILGYTMAEYYGHLHVTPTRQVASIGTASLAGGTALSTTFPLATRPTSQIIGFIVGYGNNLYNLTDPGTGYIKGDNPDEEGNGQTSMQFYTEIAGHNNSVSADLGDSTPAHDHAGGAVLVAVEVQSNSPEPATRIPFVGHFGRSRSRYPL